MFQKILVPINDSPQCQCALDAAIKMALEGGSRLALLHVRHLPIAGPSGFGNTSSTTDDEAVMAVKVLRQAQAHANRYLMCEAAVRSGFPSHQIVQFARDWGADVIVMGARGRGRLAHLLMGSTTEAVVRDA